MSADRIHIRNLRVRTLVGVRDWEREKPQDVVISVTMYHDQRAAAVADDLHATLDYKRVKDEIVHFVESTNHGLLEALAERVADLCLKAGAARVDVTVDKPGALRFAESVAVEITRP